MRIMSFGVLVCRTIYKVCFFQGKWRAALVRSKERDETRQTRNENPNIIHQQSLLSKITLYVFEVPPSIPCLPAPTLVGPLGSVRCVNPTSPI